MGCSYYNGVLLPDRPETTGYDYAVIVNGQNTDGDSLTILWLCDRPFTADGDYSNAFNHPADAAVLAYRADMTRFRWVQGQVVTEGAEDAKYSRFTGDFVWANHDIYLRDVDPPSLPTWNSADYPHMVMTRTNLGDLAANADIPEYAAFYSAQPFTWWDIEVDGMANTLSWQSDVIGAQFLNVVLNEDGSMYTMGWYIDERYGQFGYGDVYNHIVGPQFDPTSAVALADNVWSTHEIVGTANGKKIEANSWHQLKCYEQGTVEEAAVPAPTNVVVTGGGTYDQNATADTLTCTADTPEGGTLSYKWYRNGVVWGYSSTLVPSTLTTGTFEYYCVVTNTQYGDKVTAQSETLTVVVNAVEDDTGGDTGDTGGTEVTVRKPVEIIGYVLRMCGVPCAEAIAMMIAGMKAKVSAIQENSVLYILDAEGTVNGATLEVK